MTVPAYPLTWPDRFPRTLAVKRQAGTFKTALNGAIKNVHDSLRRFATASGKALGDMTISSNVTLGANRPADPGVSVWFTWDGLQVCIPVDRYTSVEANLQAIHHVLEARITELRHGGPDIVRATFQGFLALPAPASKHWTAVLDLAPTATLEEIRQRYRAKAKELHPDAGGNPDDFSELNAAYELAQREKGVSA